MKFNQALKRFTGYSMLALAIATPAFAVDMNSLDQKSGTCGFLHGLAMTANLVSMSIRTDVGWNINEAYYGAVSEAIEPIQIFEATLLDLAKKTTDKNLKALLKVSAQKYELPDFGSGYRHAMQGLTEMKNSAEEGAKLLGSATKEYCDGGTKVGQSQPAGQAVASQKQTDKSQVSAGLAADEASSGSSHVSKDGSKAENAN